jgi:hypothetical protein
MRSLLVAIAAFVAGILAGIALRDPPDAPLTAEVAAPSDRGSGATAD